MNTELAQVFRTISSENDCEPVIKDTPSEHSDISCNCQSFESMLFNVCMFGLRILFVEWRRSFVLTLQMKSLHGTTQHRTGIRYTTRKRSENSSHTNWPFFNKRKADWSNKRTTAILIFRFCSWHLMHRISL